MALTTQRLLLRQWTDADRDPFARLSADPEVMRWFPAPATAAESDALVDREVARIDENGWGLWAVELRATGAFLGFVGLAPDAFTGAVDQVEIGWRLTSAHWGNGYATEAGRAALAHAFDVVGLPEVVSFTTAGNVASRRVMERLGLTHDPPRDFLHPRLPADHPLAEHVLYAITRDEHIGT